MDKGSGKVRKRGNWTETKTGRGKEVRGRMKEGVVNLIKRKQEKTKNLSKDQMGCTLKEMEETRGWKDRRNERREIEDGI